MQPLALALLACPQQKHGEKLLRGAGTGREVITINPLLTQSQWVMQWANHVSTFMLII